MHQINLNAAIPNSIRVHLLAWFANQIGNDDDDNNNNNHSRRFIRSLYKTLVLEKKTINKANKAKIDNSGSLMKADLNPGSLMTMMIY